MSSINAIEQLVIEEKHIFTRSTEWDRCLGESTQTIAAPQVKTTTITLPTTARFVREPRNIIHSISIETGRWCVSSVSSQFRHNIPFGPRRQTMHFIHRDTYYHYPVAIRQLNKDQDPTLLELYTHDKRVCPQTFRPDRDNERRRLVSGDDRRPGTFLIYLSSSRIPSITALNRNTRCA